MNTKTCYHCGSEKDVLEFAVCKTAKDGRQWICRSCQSDYWKEYKEKKRINILAKQREYFNDPKVKELRAAQRMTPEYRARKREYAAKYRAANRSKILEYERKYKEAMRAASGSFLPEDWELLLKVYGGKCVACGGTDQLTADHVIPVSFGGSNGIENRQPLCKSCNSRKHNQSTDFRPKETIDLLQPPEITQNSPTRSRRRYIGRRRRKTA